MSVISSNVGDKQRVSSNPQQSSDILDPPYPKTHWSLSLTWHKLLLNFSSGISRDRNYLFPATSIFGRAIKEGVGDATPSVSRVTAVFYILSIQEQIVSKKYETLS